jgi:hypothetical protein
VACRRRMRWKMASWGRVELVCGGRRSGLRWGFGMGAWVTGMMMGVCSRWMGERRLWIWQMGVEV